MAGTWAAGGALNTSRLSLGGCGTQTAGLSFGGLDGGANSVVTEEYDGAAWAAGQRARAGPGDLRPADAAAA